MRRAVLAFVALLLVIAALPPASLASGESFYDNGRAQSTVLWGSDVSQSTFVISAASVYYPSQGWGRERIRVWGRNDTVRNVFSSSNYTVSGVTWANLRFLVDCATESRCEDLSVSARNPGDSGGESSFLSAITYDILGYKGVPTTTIEAFVNGLSASTSVSEPNYYDSTISINAGYLSAFPESTSSLPNYIA